ncbi:hypothetical protein, partial [Trinickia sp.]|uniref:hypothetical protein n=1 Tax=Trinickia sp. TaxID=2571163 RepID=UPI003F7EA970
GNRHTAFELAEVFNNVSHGFNRPKLFKRIGYLSPCPRVAPRPGDAAITAPGYLSLAACGTV